MLVNWIPWIELKILLSPPSCDAETYKRKDSAEWGHHFCNKNVVHLRIQLFVWSWGWTRMRKCWARTSCFIDASTTSTKHTTRSANVHTNSSRYRFSSEVGIYKRKQESKKTRKQEKKNSIKKVIKKKRKCFLFFSWSSSCFLSCFLVF